MRHNLLKYSWLNQRGVRVISSLPGREVRASFAHVRGHLQDRLLRLELLGQLPLHFFSVLSFLMNVSEVQYRSRRTWKRKGTTH